MKKLLAFALVATLGISAQAQNKNAKYDLHVKGNCGQCKERIEKAAYSLKGVKTAEWDENTQNLHIILNEKKSKVDDVENAVVAVGHDTNDKKADEKVYNALNSCCLYDREGENAAKPNEAKADAHAGHVHS
jgi:periplasmic mercuric ion binding protein